MSVERYLRADRTSIAVYGPLTESILKLAKKMAVASITDYRAWLDCPRKHDRVLLKQHKARKRQKKRAARVGER